MAATCRKKTAGNYQGGGLCLKNRRKLDASGFMFGSLEAKARFACRRRRRKIWRLDCGGMFAIGAAWCVARWLKVSCKSVANVVQGG